MTDDIDTDPASGASPTPPLPGSSPGRRGLGLRRRTATLAAMGGLTAGGVVGGLVVSHAADSTSSPTSSPAAAASPSPGGSSSTNQGGSNEDPTHEQGESPQREAEENSGNFHGGGPHGPGGPGGLQTEDQQLVATALGITTTQLQTELSGGKTIAAVAKEHNADVNALISTWVASENKEIDDRVASGALTKAQGDQDKTMTQQRVTDEVNGTHPDH
jgi:hypothetical protein